MQPVKFRCSFFTVSICLFVILKRNMKITRSKQARCLLDTPLLSSHSYLYLAVKPAVQSDPDQSDKSVSSVLFFLCGFVFNIFSSNMSLFVCFVLMCVCE